MQHERIRKLIVLKLTREASPEELLELEQLTQDDEGLSFYLQVLESLKAESRAGNEPISLSEEGAAAAYQRLAKRIAGQQTLRSGTPGNPMLKSHLKIAWRNLSKHKTSTCINMLGLALGISACLIIYLITSFELSYDNFHPGKEQIYRAVSEFSDPATAKKYFIPQIPYRAALAIRNEFSGVESIATFCSYYANVTIPGAGKEVKKFEVPKMWEEPSDIILTEPQYFSIFRYTWLAGNEATALNEPFKVVLTEKKARLYFGSLSPTDVIGKQIIYEDSLRLVVSGIVKDWGKNTDLAYTEFISYSTIEHSFLKHKEGLNHDPRWLYGNAETFVRLAKEATPHKFETQSIPMVKTQLQPDYGHYPMSLHLQPLPAIHFDSKYQDLYIRKAHLPTLYGLMGIAAFILVIAAINFINLSTAQSLRRAKEIGIRKVLGSSRANLIFQFLGEALILTSLATLLSMLIVSPVLSIFRAFIPSGVTFNPVNIPTLIFLSAITTVTAVLAGFYPARVLSSWLPALSLKGKGAQLSNPKNYLRKTLIVFQFTVSLLFIIGTIIVQSQVHFMLNKDMGVSRDPIVSFYTNEDFEVSKKQVMMARLRQLPGVKEVSLGADPPVRDGFRGGTITRRDKPVQVLAAEREGDENYIPLYGLKIVAGRNFTVLHSDSIAEFLVNETCAKQLGFVHPADALGHSIKTQGTLSGPIVGILADFYSQSLQAPLGPAYIFSSNNSRFISLKLSTSGQQPGDLTTILTQMKKIWKDVYPNEKFEYEFFDDAIARYYDKEQKTAQIMHTAMIIAILISCMGLFGLITFTAEQRTKEIGIRKVLGASVSSIVTLLSKDFLRLIIISIIIATPVAWWLMSKWLNDFAYRITISGWVFVLSGVSAIALGLITISFQAIKAAIAHPVKSLRTE